MNRLNELPPGDYCPECSRLTWETLETEPGMYDEDWNLLCNMELRRCLSCLSLWRVLTDLPT
ncbi:hypothetical protein M1M38_gp039 [Halorubrum tailed virus 27]|uniref:Uncharacterized protein n=1 Tax=Halorubrum tailed virus 27 TaxID=2878008 RepID=A0AAE8XYZ1_9CAUD|nr:hypothetical protein M1M38_gp039 [Halorubrum tailed virus 27]UBF22732.1 hypothetical protein HRTV-27_gp39 [Halorubrum tailed virus 27]